MSVWAGLIERLEKATGPDRDIDQDIFHALDLCQKIKINGEPAGCADYHAPRYTSSIDAALTLVPVGCYVAEMGECADPRDGWFKARLAPRAPGNKTLAMYQNFYVGFNDGGKPASMPIALCIASIKARVSHGVDEPG
jgi:hypothetical protein